MVCDLGVGVVLVVVMMVGSICGLESQARIIDRFSSRSGESAGLSALRHGATEAPALRVAQSGRVISTMQ